MGKTIIVSEETIRDLLEAHASLSASYYELQAALQRANGTAHPPDDTARAAFLPRMAIDFPEVAAVVRAIGTPRFFVPPPPAIAVPMPPPVGVPAQVGAAILDPPTVSEPSLSRAREPAPGTPAAGGPAPPEFVVPSNVKYEGNR
jgi:hypothetical protein